MSSVPGRVGETASSWPSHRGVPGVLRRQQGGQRGRSRVGSMMSEWSARSQRCTLGANLIRDCRDFGFYSEYNGEPLKAYE